MIIENRWKVAVGTALLTLSSYAAMAQSGPPPGPPSDGTPQGQMERGQRQERELNMLTRLLALTPDQQTGVKALLEQQVQQMRALRDKTPAAPSTGQAQETPQARMTQMDQIREETDTKIAALLDDTQKKTFAEWVQKRKAAMEKRRPQDENPSPSGTGSGSSEPSPNS
jgi:periplasmic protein CpxP/Spy